MYIVISGNYLPLSNRLFHLNRQKSSFFHTLFLDTSREYILLLDRHVQEVDVLETYNHKLQFSNNFSIMCVERDFVSW